MSNTREVPGVIPDLIVPVKTDGVLVLFAGPTGSGKSTVQNALLERNSNMGRVVTATSRPIRPGEQQDVDYHFYDREGFEEQIANGALLESGEYGGNYYGIPKREILPVLAGNNRTIVMTMDKASEIDVFIRNAYEEEEARLLQERVLTVYIGIPSLMSLRKRFLSREGSTKGEFARRIREDWVLWQDNRHAFDHTIINREGALEETVSQIEIYIDKKKNTLS